jgi:hypothetical protein
MQVQAGFLILTGIFAAGCASIPPQSLPPPLQPCTEQITGTISTDVPKSLMAELQPPTSRLVGTFEFTGRSDPISQSPVRSKYHTTLTIRVTDPATGHVYADAQTITDGETSDPPDELWTHALGDVEMKLKLMWITLSAATQPTTR